MRRGKRRILAGCLLCVTILLLGSAGIASGDEYDVVPVRRGDVVQTDGNLVSDTYILSVRECQIEVDKLREQVDAAPKEQSKTFMDGVLWGGAGATILLLVLR